jgi:putative addiction module CopG family antidote
MTVSLSKEQEALVERLMQSGRFSNSQLVVQEALHLLEDKLQALQNDIQSGLDSLDQGHYNEYTAETLPQHLQAIKERNQSRLAKKS